MDYTRPIGPGLTGGESTIDDSAPAVSTASFWDNLTKVISNVTGAASQAYQQTVLSQRPIITYPGTYVGPSGQVIPATTTGMLPGTSTLLMVAAIIIGAILLFKRR